MKSGIQKTSEPSIPSAQAFVFNPRIGHSVWVDVVHRKRSLKSLEAYLRKSVRSGEYAGYRLMELKAEYIGISWPKS